jgi:hypothetical protein
VAEGTQFQPIELVHWDNSSCRLLLIYKLVMSCQFEFSRSCQCAIHLTNAHWKGSKRLFWHISPHWNCF